MEANNSDIRLLRIFLVLMAERSVSRAAVRLGLSQPATSHALARLRELFQDPLLLKSRGRMIATERAEQAAEAAHRIVAAFDDLTTPQTGFDPATARRTFVLTAPEFGERVLVPHLFKHLRAHAPDIRVEVHAPNPDKSYELLESGEVDFRVAWLLKPPHVSLRSMQLFQDQMVCIAARDHPTVQGTLTLEQFVTLPHARTLGMSHVTTSRVIDEAVARHGRRLSQSFLVQNFLTILATLPGTDIIATMPSSLARFFAAYYPLQVLPPPLRLPRVRYAAYWHERRQKDAGHRWMREALLQAARTLAL